MLFNDTERSQSLLAGRFEAPIIPGDTVAPVIDDVLMGTWAGRHFATVSSTGTLVYAPSTRGQEVLQWLDPDGTLTPIRRHDVGIANPRLSPAGDRVAFQGDLGLWILDLRRGSVDVLVPGSAAAASWNPLWAPDGHAVTIGSQVTGKNWDLYEIAPGGEPVPLLVKEFDQGPESWSPDGRALIFSEYHPERGMDLWILPRGGQPEEFVVTSANESAAVFSPEGRFVAYVSDRTGRFEVYVRAFPEGRSFAVSSDGGEEPQWSPDGNELFFRRGDSLYAVSTRSGFESSTPRLILTQPFDRNAYRERAAYDVAADGRFLVVTNTWNTEFKVVFNWFEELERLVPTDNGQ
jgi:Tol biopolymer transport system component